MKTQFNYNYDSSFLENYNKITEKDLEELKKIEAVKIVFTKPFATYKVGDILDVKVFRNLYQSEPPNFLVVDEKVGSPKYGFGGRGSTPFYTRYEGEATFPSADNANGTDASGETFLQKHKNHLLIAGALVIGYFAYKKFNK